MDEIRIGCLLKQIKAALDQYGKENMEELDITPSQCFMINYLLSVETSDLCATDIYENLGISRAAVSVLLKSLREKEYLTMEGDCQDDRRKKIFLTKKAHEMSRQIEKSLKKREECLCRGISEEELEQLEKILLRMIFNLKQKGNKIEVNG